MNYIVLKTLQFEMKDQKWRQSIFIARLTEAWEDYKGKSNVKPCQVFFIDFDSLICPPALQQL